MMSFLVRTLLAALHCQPGLMSRVSLLPVAKVESSAVLNTVTPLLVVVAKSLVKASAVKNGLLTEEEAEKRSEQEALSLIFQSGISTSAIITEISGRGLGMAIVREKVEKRIRCQPTVAAEAEIAEFITRNRVDDSTRSHAPDQAVSRVGDEQIARCINRDPAGSV